MTDADEARRRGCAHDVTGGRNMDGRAFASVAALGTCSDGRRRRDLRSRWAEQPQRRSLRRTELAHRLEAPGPTLNAPAAVALGGRIYRHRRLRRHDERADGDGARLRSADAELVARSAASRAERRPRGCRARRQDPRPRRRERRLDAGRPRRVRTEDERVDEARAAAALGGKRRRGRLPQAHLRDRRPQRLRRLRQHVRLRRRERSLEPRPAHPAARHGGLGGLRRRDLRLRRRVARRRTPCSATSTGCAQAPRAGNASASSRTRATMRAPSCSERRSASSAEAPSPETSMRRRAAASSSVTPRAEPRIFHESHSEVRVPEGPGELLRPWL